MNEIPLMCTFLEMRLSNIYYMCGVGDGFDTILLKEKKGVPLLPNDDVI